MQNLADGLLDTIDPKKSKVPQGFLSSPLLQLLCVLKLHSKRSARQRKDIAGPGTRVEQFWEGRCVGGKKAHSKRAEPHVVGRSSKEGDTHKEVEREQNCL
jgi:hypothetical protein